MTWIFQRSGGHSEKLTFPSIATEDLWEHVQQNHVRKRGSSWQRWTWGGVSILVPQSPALAWEAQWEKHFLCGWSITLPDVEPDQESSLDNSCNVCRYTAGCAGTLRSCWDTLQERACKHCQRAEAACKWLRWQCFFMLKNGGPNCSFKTGSESLV